MNIYVGNLSPDVTEEDLKSAFEQLGQVESVNLIKDKFSGEPRGFGFVIMPSKEEALAAIEQLNGKDIKGKAIKVNEALGTKKSGPRRGPGGGGGGGPRRGGFGGGDRRGGGGGGGGGGYRSGGGGGGGGRRY